MESSVNTRARTSTRPSPRLVGALVLCLGLFATACSDSDPTPGSAESADSMSIVTEVGGVLAEAPSAVVSSDSNGSSALGFRIDPGLEASLSAVQLGVDLDGADGDLIAAAQPQTANDASAGAADGDDAAPDDAAANDTTANDTTTDDGTEADGTATDGSGADQDEASPASTPVQTGTLDDFPTGPGAPAVWVATAKDTTGYVQLYDAPNGTPISIDYQYLDGSTLEYQVWNPTFFGGPLSLLVVGGNPEVDDFVQVQLPVRPTGTTAWVDADQFAYFLNDHYVEIDVATNTVRAWKGTELLLESSAVTGRPDRPTPVLRTYIDEKLPGPNSAYGPWMLTLAAFSESLNTFGAGLPKLAVHGTNEPGLMGQYASSGCIRLPNDVINQLAELVPVGTRVDIIRS